MKICTQDFEILVRSLQSLDYMSFRKIVIYAWGSHAWSFDLSALFFLHGPFPLLTMFIELSCVPYRGFSQIYMDIILWEGQFGFTYIIESPAQSLDEYIQKITNRGYFQEV